jgi:hypothetical protein
MTGHVVDTYHDAAQVRWDDAAQVQWDDGTMTVVHQLDLADSGGGVAGVAGLAGLAEVAGFRG